MRGRCPQAFQGQGTPPRAGAMPAVDPADLADTLWSMHTERDTVEEHAAGTLS